jgi:hypothetical protein
VGYRTPQSATARPPLTGMLDGSNDHDLSSKDHHPTTTSHHPNELMLSPAELITITSDHAKLLI